MKIQSKWSIIGVCKSCRSTRINRRTNPPFCKSCGQLGEQLVMRRRTWTFPFTVTNQYRKYDNYVNPFSEKASR